MTLWVFVGMGAATGVATLGVFTAFYVLCAALTWWVYLRRSLLLTRVSSLAHANV